MKEYLLLVVLLVNSVVSQSQSPDKAAEVTFEAFGCKGDIDETEKIQKAFTLAKQQHLPIRLMGKRYIFSPTGTVDITGIPLITGSGTIDVSKTGKSAGKDRMLAVFHVEGKKKLLQSAIRIDEGDRELVIGKNLSIRKGSVIFITSSEPLPNTKRPYYCKGQRMEVSEYIPSSGKLQFSSSIEYSFLSACLWWLEEEPVIAVTKEVRFITAPMNFITCFRLYYAKGNFSGYYKNFALTAIMYKSSSGVVNEMEADLPITDNNGYSHCIEVADLSDVLIRNCRLTGGRHVISGTAGGLWEKNECGGNGHAGYPSNLEIDGGIYRGARRVNNINADNATLDSHGVVGRMIIKNCTVYGGINLGGREVLVDNVTIYADEKRILNIGSDVEPDADWGDYTIRNSTFIGDPGSTVSLLYAKANVRSITLDNIKVESVGRDAYFADFRYFTPKKFLVERVSFKEKLSGQRPWMISNRRNKMTIKNSDLDSLKIKWMN